MWLPSWNGPDSTIGRSADALSVHHASAPLAKSVVQVPVSAKA
jgi:hypothetical protein